MWEGREWRNDILPVRSKSICMISRIRRERKPQTRRTRTRHHVCAGSTTAVLEALSPTLASATFR